MSLEAIEPSAIEPSEAPIARAEELNMPQPFESRAGELGHAAGETALHDVPFPRLSPDINTLARRRRRVARVLSSTADTAELISEAVESTNVALTAEMEMLRASTEYMEAVANYPIREPAHDLRQTTVTIQPPRQEASTPTGWKPSRTFEYGSHDPFHDLNPELVKATTGLIETTIAQAQNLRPTNDPELTYLSTARSKRGKKMTLLTKSLTAIDPGLADWITHLPDAERLRPVAKPWSDEPTYIFNPEGTDGEDSLSAIPPTPAQQVLMGASGDGRAVREREAWERTMMLDAIRQADLKDGTLTITSLGTGTGEPAMDTSIDVMHTIFGESGYKIVVNGFDVNPASLATATQIARNKTEDGSLTFVPAMANLLSADGIEKAVGQTGADVYEAIGFAEYVPSDDAPTEMEREQRELMKKVGCLSAQEFYGAIYENMPKGSILLTGNMRDDSPQAQFVIDGLGWKGIIQRSTEDYMRILEQAGIPSEAVSLYMPDAENSAGVYNLVAIKKI